MRLPVMNATNNPQELALEERTPSSNVARAGTMRGVGWWVFLAFAALFILSTHGHVIGMGYEGESYLTARQIVEHGDVSMFGTEVAGQPKSYSRNDLSQPILLVPFYLIARLMPAGSVFGGEWVVSLFNPLVSALIVLLIYKFAVSMFASTRRAVLIALLSGLATMIWPYAVIGMEPLQVLLVLAAAYTTYLFRRQGSVRYLLMAGLSLALLYQTKRASFILLPVLLLYVAFAIIQQRRSARYSGLLGMLAILGCLAVSAGSAMWFQAVKDTGLVEGATPDSAASFLSKFPGPVGWQPVGLYGFLFSAGKSFFLFNPPALLGLLAFPTFLRRNKVEGVLFAGLAVTPYLFYSLAFGWGWADETWGPRYVYSAIPFALFSLGALDKSKLRSLGWRLALGLSLGLGIIIQILGLLFWYGRYFNVLTAAKLNTLPNIQYEPLLSHIWINLLMVGSFISTRFLGRPVYFEYSPRYWFGPTPDLEQIAQTRHLDLTPFSTPALWFPAVLVDNALPMKDRIMAAVLMLVLLAALTLAAIRIIQVLRLKPQGFQNSTSAALSL